MDMEERRRFPRLPFNTKVEYKVLDQEEARFFTTVTKDISIGGICIRLLEKFQPGTILKLNFSIPGLNKPIIAKGRIVWVRQLSTGISRLYESGIEFASINDDDRKIITEFTEKRRGDRMVEKAPKKILIVDDEEDILTYLSNILKRANYQVISASKGREAVDLAIHELPDLIILDIALLDDMDGGDVAFTLSEKPSTADIPIIFLTALMRKDEEKKLGKSGRRYMMAKPVTQVELLKMIDKALIG